MSAPSMEHVGMNALYTKWGEVKLYATENPPRKEQPLHIARYRNCPPEVMVRYAVFAAAVQQLGYDEMLKHEVSHGDRLSRYVLRNMKLRKLPELNDFL